VKFTSVILTQMEIPFINTFLLLPPLQMESIIFLYIPIGILLLVSFSAIKLLIILFANRSLTVYKTKPLQLNIQGRSIAIFGDSTAVGTGSKNVEETLAGRLAKDFPHTNIINLAENGSKTIGVSQQIQSLHNKKVDMAIISTGGNDIWAYTSSRKLVEDLRSILEQAKEISDHHVILLFFGNEGTAPFFPWPIRSWLNHRTELVKNIFLFVANEQKVPIIDLFSNPRENPFVIDPKRYFAEDRLHPSGAGYGEWYKRMWRIMVERGYLYHDTDSEGFIK